MLDFTLPRYRVVRDEDLCIQCGVCERSCSNKVHKVEEDLGKVTAAQEICGVGYADCDAGKLSFVVKADGASKEDTVSIGMDLTKAYLFDAETRLTLLARDSGYVKTEYTDADVTPLPYAEEEEIKNKLKLKPDTKKKKR